MRWFPFEAVVQGNMVKIVLVQAKMKSSADKRLDRWGNVHKVEKVTSLNKGTGFETMSEGWAMYKHVSVIDSSW